jgi:hypothetical protein
MILGSTKHVWDMCWGGRGVPIVALKSHMSCFEILEKIRETCFVCGCFELGFLQFTSEFS